MQMNKEIGFRYKNLILTGIGILFALFLLRFEIFHSFLLQLGEMGYLGAFIGGILFVSTFTVGTGILILLILSENLNPIEIGLIAGLGAVAGDLVIFRFIKNSLADEIVSIYNHVDHDHHFTKLLQSKYFSWTLPVVGAIIIASPLPDEIGVSLMGISKMKTYQFLLVSFILNSIGIFLVISASFFVKP